MCRGELSAVIAWLMSKCLWSEWKWYRGLKEIVSPFPCCPVNRECSWKKTQIEKKLCREFSKTLIVDCAASSLKIHGTPCIASRAYWEWNFYASRNAQIKLSLQRLLCVYKTLALKTYSWLWKFYPAMVHLKLANSHTGINNCTES